MKNSIIGLIILAASAYWMLSYHFVLLDGSIKILKKTDIRYEDTFVDARGAKKLNLALKPDLIAAGINDIIAEASESVKKDAVK